MAKRKKKRPTTCAYGRRTVRFCDTERDHVPPRGIFPKPWPDNFITVRCCERCHRNLSDGDELLKVLAGMGLVRSDMSQGIKPEVDRALARNPWWKSSLVESAKAATPIEINYGAIRETGQQLVIKGEVATAVNTTVVRTAKGILFHHDPGWDSTKFDFDVQQFREDTPQQLQEIGRELGPLPCRVMIGNKAFLAAWGFAQDQPDHGIMVMSFYGGLNLAVFIAPRGRSRFSG